LLLLFDMQMTHLWNKKTIILLKVIKFCHNGSNNKIRITNWLRKLSRVTKIIQNTGSQLNFSRFYLKNIKLLNVVWCEGLQFLNLNRLKLIDLPNRYNNTATLNLKIDRFQVNNEYSRHTCKTKKNDHTSESHQNLPQWK
jgi:hypothetical protein